ncbi:MAG: hypothetical protein ACRDSF_00220 [Pseudonocardiaceae bacterium]
MIHTFRYPTVTELHEGILEELVYSKRSKVDDDISISVSMHNVIASAKSFQWDFDLKTLWLTRHRWSMMVNQYLNAGALDYWLDSIAAGIAPKKNARGIATMRMNEVKPRQSGRGVTRRWGSCMLALSYRQIPRPQITLHSRTSYLGYIAALDLTLAYKAAQLVSEITGIAVSDMQFVWQLEAAQYHPMRSMAWILGDEDRREEFWAMDLGREECPGFFHTKKWFDQIDAMDNSGKLYEEMTYATFCRIRKRLHTEVYGYPYGEDYETESNKRFAPLPSLSVEDLTIKFAKKAKEPDPDKVELNYDGVPD